MLRRTHNAPSKISPEDSISCTELKKKLDNGEQIVLVDLREKNEIEMLKEYSIPNSIFLPNPPLDDATFRAILEPSEDSAPSDFFSLAYKLPPLRWKAVYGSRKPQRADQVVFYSFSHKRSLVAVKSALRLGFTNVKYLHGGSKIWNKYFNPLGIDPNKPEGEIESPETQAQPENIGQTNQFSTEKRNDDKLLQQILTNEKEDSSGKWEDDVIEEDGKISQTEKELSR